MTSKSIPFDLDDLLTELEFLSQIIQDKKPCMNDMTLVDSTSWFGAFKRYISGETRDKVINGVKKIVDKAIESIQTHKDNEFLSLIINKLSQARQGIETLALTYKNDPKMISRINVILANIDLQLNRNRNFITGNNPVFDIKPISKLKFDGYLDDSKIIKFNSIKSHQINESDNNIINPIEVNSDISNESDNNIIKSIETITNESDNNIINPIEVISNESDNNIINPIEVITNESDNNIINPIEVISNKSNNNIIKPIEVKSSNIITNISKLNENNDIISDISKSNIVKPKIIRRIIRNISDIKKK